ncbi:MAG: hypothetical protein EOO17_05950 [Chloroflexi bacterium]|nr:MAG: hypothetical protein EOO17_05950 [Chloroflexota bacterium]
MNYEGLRHVTNDDLTDAQRADIERHQASEKETIKIMEDSLKGELAQDVGARAVGQTRLEDAYAIARMNQDPLPADPLALPSFKKEGGETTGGIDA